MKNPARQFIHAYAHWRRMAPWPGLFPRRDALLQFNRVVLPARFHYREGGVWLAESTRISQEDDGVWRIDLVDHDLTFFWPEEPDNNLWFLIEQEYDSRNPHCYTTPPINLTPESVVIDVGACEGLFAFRLLKAGLARQVICFEPWASMADLIQRGGEHNGVSGGITLERLAVAARPGRVAFEPGVDAASGRIVEAADGDGGLPATSIDAYCRESGLTLGPSDLIKIDAEGADVDILRGAEEQIRRGGPQIAVTTYHDEAHAKEAVECLLQWQPNYRLRLKGFSFWTPEPRPTLLQASLPDSDRSA